MYKPVFLDERVELTASEISEIQSLDGVKQALLSKLKRVEGKCNANGYVKPGSVQFLARSMGAAENGKFTGNWIYDCKYSCLVLKPVAYDPKEVDAEASVLPCKVIAVNPKMGAYAVFDEAIRVLLPRDTHVGDPAFDALKEGAVVRVRMEKHRFATNDDCILAVGSLYKGPSSGDREGPPAAAAAGGAEEGKETSEEEDTEEEEEKAQGTA
jgi:hypothetical protein